MKNTQRFAELEYALKRYFDGKVTQVMKASRMTLATSRPTSTALLKEV